jgi:hypothetical protein
MARHVSLKAHNGFDIAFLPAHRASAHAGQLAIKALLNQFGLWRRIHADPDLEVRLQKGKGFDPEVLIAQFLFCFTSGGVSLADAERLNEDAALKALLGTPRFADQTTLGEWLRALGAPGVQALRRLGREFVQWALQQAEPARYQHNGRLELFFDDTQIEVSSAYFEGAQINYEGHWALSWQTLWVGPFIADSVLGGHQPHQGKPGQRGGGQRCQRLPARTARRQPGVVGQPPHLFLRRQRFQRRQVLGSGQPPPGRLEHQL